MVLLVSPPIPEKRSACVLQENQAFPFTTMAISSHPLPTQKTLSPRTPLLLDPSKKAPTEPCEQGGKGSPQRGPGKTFADKQMCFVNMLLDG
jgi:hypothetical protein